MVEKKKKADRLNQIDKAIEDARRWGAAGEAEATRLMCQRLILEELISIHADLRALLPEGTGDKP